MKKAISVAIVFFLLLTAFSTFSARAQSAVELRGGGGTVDMLENYTGFIGAGIWISQSTWPVSVNVSGSYHLADDIRSLGVDFNQKLYTFYASAVYRGETGNGDVGLYGGGGFSISHLSMNGSVQTSVGNYSDSDGSTKPGIYLIGGADYDIGAVRPFVQFEMSFSNKFTVFNVDTNGGGVGLLSFGLRVPIGRE